MLADASINVFSLAREIQRSTGLALTTCIPGATRHFLTRAEGPLLVTSDQSRETPRSTPWQGVHDEGSMLLYAPACACDLWLSGVQKAVWRVHPHTVLRASGGRDSRAPRKDGQACPADENPSVSVHAWRLQPRECCGTVCAAQRGSCPDSYGGKGGEDYGPSAGARTGAVESGTTTSRARMFGSAAHRLQPGTSHIRTARHSGEARSWALAAAWLSPVKIGIGDRSGAAGRSKRGANVYSSPPPEPLPVDVGFGLGNCRLRRRCVPADESGGVRVPACAVAACNTFSDVVHGADLLRGRIRGSNYVYVKQANIFDLHLI
ncbi:hypothetical protein GGX14DRAFT_677712 [Mycena pura]|uniref:Uncharacterized protein n=1 Tax=Mycena pura TaxID=153505 RepID=A0AAD6Y5E9_9AGAR|nr:hypothetical protein GGX14DRAFT_677712 [Mycena pura]